MALADEYLDVRFKTYEGYQKYLSTLAKQGFKWTIPVSTREDEYMRTLEEASPNPRLIDARTAHCFRNEVEERTWDLKDKRVEFVRINMVDTDGLPLEDMVMFFVRYSRD